MQRFSDFCIYQVYGVLRVDFFKRHAGIQKPLKSIFMRKKNRLLSVILIGMILFMVSCEKSDLKINPKDLGDPIKIELRGAETKIVKTDQQFAFEFFSQVFNEEKGESFMVSPLSLSMALAMTSNGAAGETEIAIQKTLKMEDYNAIEINEYYKKLKDALLITDPSTKLSIANSIFTNKFIAIKPDFLNTNKKYFDAETSTLDFGSVEAVGVINKWAYDNTNGLIKDIIDKTTSDDLMYLLNAIYFKGIWTSKFDKKNTSKKEFRTEDDTKKNVDMMHQTANFNYTEDEIMQMVQLPYGNEAFSMMVLLPKSGKKQNDVVVALQDESYWNNISSTLRDSEVELYLPRFKTEYSKKLNEILIDMGMGIAFSNAADFSGMSDYAAAISLVKQNTYISTDEEGTEAAAVTVVGIETTSEGPPKKVVFDANRPFIYIIRENSTGAVLFMGSVAAI